MLTLEKYVKICYNKRQKDEKGGIAMKNEKINKAITIFIMILTIIPIININNISNAEAKGFEGFNNAPRKYMSAEKDKFSDVSLTLKDNNGIKSVSLYKVDDKGNKTKINFSTADTKDDKNQKYTLSHEKLLKGKTKRFYIKATDKTGNVLATEFRVCAKTNPDHYAIDDGPRIVNWTANGTSVSLGVKDNEGTKYIKIQDANNNNTEIYKLNNLAKGEAKVKIDMKKFKKVDDIYKLRIVAEDAGKTNEQSIRRLSFKVNETTQSKPSTSTNTNSNKTNNTTTTNTKGKNVSSFIAALEKISQRVQSDYKKGIKWKYTNGEGSENGLPFKYTFQAALKTNTLTTNCADYVMWALHDCGIFTANQKFYGNNAGGITFKKPEETKVKETLKKYATIKKAGGVKPKTLVKQGKLKKGDILTYKGHTNVYAGNGKWYDAGRRMKYNGHGSMTNYTFTTLGPIKSNYNQPTCYVIRLKNQT